MNNNANVQNQDSSNHPIADASNPKWGSGHDGIQAHNGLPGSEMEQEHETKVLPEHQKNGQGGVQDEAAEAVLEGRYMVNTLLPLIRAHFRMSVGEPINVVARLNLP